MRIRSYIILVDPYALTHILYSSSVISILVILLYYCYILFKSIIFPYDDQSMLDWNRNSMILNDKDHY